MESQEAHLQEQIYCLKTFYKKGFSETKNLLIISIIFNLIFWLFLILIIISYTRGKNDENIINFDLPLILGFIISYLIYIIVEFCWASFNLLSVKDEKIIKEKMGDFFKAKPFICLNISCYHYEKNNNDKYEESSIVYSHKKEIEYKYFFGEI